MKRCYANNIRSYTVPKISDILLRTSVELNIFDSPLYLSRNIDGLPWDQAFLKRMEDILVSGIMLILTSPFFLIIALMIKCTDKGPVFYTQQRLTLNGKVFPIYKFRTMVVDAEKKSGPVKAGDKDPRILPVGHFLRATRLDELPQLLNILKGDMSLVGTRPPTVDEWEKYDLRHRVRLSVKPGITGMWQVSGRSEITDFEEVVKLDKKYITEWRMGLDIKILLQTVQAVLGRDGAM